MRHGPDYEGAVAGTPRRGLGKQSDARSDRGAGRAGCDYMTTMPGVLVQYIPLKNPPKALVKGIQSR